MFKFLNNSEDLSKNSNAEIASCNCRGRAYFAVTCGKSAQWREGSRTNKDRQGGKRFAMTSDEEH